MAKLLEFTASLIKSLAGQEDDSEQPLRMKRAKQILVWVLKIGVAAGLLFFLVKTITVAELQVAIQGADPLLLVLAALLSPVNLWLQALRWRTFVRSEYPDRPFYRIFNSVLGGFAIGLITPGRVGEVGRVFLLHVPKRIRLVGLHVVDKLYFMGFVGSTGPLLLYTMPGFADALPQQMHSSALVFVLCLPLVYLWLGLDARPIRSLLLGIQIAFGSKSKYMDMLNAYEGLSLRHTSRALLYTLLQMLLILTQFFLLTRAFQEVGWSIAARTYGAVLFVKTVLPVSIGSLGVGEWAAVSFYERFGISDATAFSASLLLFGLNVLLPALFGLIVVLQTRAKTIAYTVEKPKDTSL